MVKILKYMTTRALAAVMFFGTMTTAFAVENSGQVVGNDQKGSITIHKYKMPDAENAFESNTENGGISLFLKFGKCEYVKEMLFPVFLIGQHHVSQ